MKIPRDPGKALELILRQKPVPIHYGHMSAGRHKRRFMISCGAGFDSEVCRAVHYSKLKKLFNRIFLGNLVYGFISVRKLLFRTLFSAKVSCDNDEASLSFKDITFITAFNSAYEGGGFKFCPPAESEKGRSAAVLHPRSAPVQDPPALSSGPRRTTSCFHTVYRFTGSKKGSIAFLCTGLHPYGR